MPVTSTKAEKSHLRDIVFTMFQLPTSNDSKSKKYILNTSQHALAIIEIFKFLKWPQADDLSIIIQPHHSYMQS